jgi:hypothetical protein
VVDLVRALRTWMFGDGVRGYAGMKNMKTDFWMLRHGAVADLL